MLAKQESRFLRFPILRHPGSEIGTAQFRRNSLELTYIVTLKPVRLLVIWCGIARGTRLLPARAAIHPAPASVAPRPVTSFLDPSALGLGGGFAVGKFLEQAAQGLLRRFLLA